MANEIMGVSVGRLEEPIRQALNEYKDRYWRNSDDELGLDADKACRLVLTPDKPNSARSETDVIFREEKIGKLYVIAFKPGDGSGSEVDFKLESLKVEKPYPKEPKIVPRRKNGIYAEAHLALVRFALEDPLKEPQLYAGMLDLLELEGETVQKIGYLGYSIDEKVSGPLTTLTVGYCESERFGDPHAVYNPNRDLQVCGFLAITDAVDERYPDILVGLDPWYPFD